MEVETWFLAELNHYNKIDKRLTINLIKDEFLDLNSILNFESEIEEPAKTLHNIYELVGKFYDKNKKRVVRTVNSLDYANLYLNNRDDLSSLNEFLTHIDGFFEENN